MKVLHNNPNLNEPRMPWILTEEMADMWIRDKLLSNKENRLNFSDSNPSPDLKYHSVNPLSGTQYIGNVSEICRKVIYPGVVVK